MKRARAREQWKIAIRQLRSRFDATGMFRYSTPGTTSGQATALSDTMSFQEVEKFTPLNGVCQCLQRGGANPVESRKGPCHRRKNTAELPRFSSPLLVKFTHSI